MSPGSQSSCVTVPTQISSSGNDSMVVEAKKRGHGKVGKNNLFIGNLLIHLDKELLNSEELQG
jgi:hypothetical protein